MERKRLTIDVLVADDQYFGKVDLDYVFEQLATAIQQVIFSNQGIEVKAVKPGPIPMHDHNGRDGCNSCFQHGEDGERFYVSEDN